MTTRLQKYLDTVAEQNRIAAEQTKIFSSIAESAAKSTERVEAQLVETASQISRLTSSMNELSDTVRGQSHLINTMYEQRELDQKWKDKAEERYEKLDEKIDEKHDKIDDRLRVVEQAAGVSNIFNDISKGKIMNSIGWIIAAVSVLYLIFKDIGAAG